jgi:hypothetical protein
MRLPRMRFTIRRMMVAIAVVAAILGLIEERRARFRRISLAHTREQANLNLTDLDVYLIIEPRQTGANPSPSTIKAEAARMRATIPFSRFLDHHARMAEKYQRASSRPWLLVASDPPAPLSPSKEYLKRLLDTIAIP